MSLVDFKPSKLKFMYEWILPYWFFKMKYIFTIKISDVFIAGSSEKICWQCSETFQCFCNEYVVEDIFCWVAKVITISIRYKLSFANYTTKMLVFQILTQLQAFSKKMLAYLLTNYNTGHSLLELFKGLVKVSFATSETIFNM